MAWCLRRRASHVGGSVVRSGEKSQFGVEILIDNKGRPAELKEGLAFVPIQREEIYSVMLKTLEV